MTIRQYKVMKENYERRVRIEEILTSYPVIAILGILNSAIWLLVMIMFS